MLWMRSAAMTALFLLAAGNSASAQTALCPTGAIGAGGAVCSLDRPQTDGRHDAFFGGAPVGGGKSVESRGPDGSDPSDDDAGFGHHGWTGKPGSHLHLGRGDDRDGRKGDDRGHGNRDRDGYGKGHDRGDRHGRGGDDRGRGDHDRGGKGDRGKGNHDRGGKGDRGHGNHDHGGKGDRSNGNHDHGGKGDRGQSSKGGKGHDGQSGKGHGGQGGKGQGGQGGKGHGGHGSRA